MQPSDPHSSAASDGLRWDCRIGWRTTSLGFGTMIDSPHCWNHVRDVRSINDDHCLQGQRVPPKPIPTGTGWPS